MKQRDEMAQLVATAEVQLSPDIRQQYDRLIKAMGADTFAAVENRICQACNTEVTAQLAHNLLMQQYVTCRSCGRVLYLKET